MEYDNCTRSKFSLASAQHPATPPHNCTVCQWAETEFENDWSNVQHKHTSYITLYACNYWSDKKTSKTSQRVNNIRVRCRIRDRHRKREGKRKTERGRRGGGPERGREVMVFPILLHIESDLDNVVAVWNDGVTLISSQLHSTPDTFMWSLKRVLTLSGLDEPLHPASSGIKTNNCLLVSAYINFLTTTPKVLYYYSILICLLLWYNVI